MGPAEILVSGGVAAMLAAVVGGGLKAFGTEMPLLASAGRQAVVFLVGIGLVLAGLAAGGSLHWRGDGAAAASAAPAGQSATVDADRNAAASAAGPASSPAATSPATAAVPAEPSGEALLAAASADDLDGVRRNLTHQTFGARGSEGMNALMIAADKCRMGIARHILESGVLTRADVDAKNAFGDTALAIAGGTDSELRTQGVARQRCPALIPLLENFRA